MQSHRIRLGARSAPREVTLMKQGLLFFRKHAKSFAVRRSMLPLNDVARAGLNPAQVRGGCGRGDTARPMHEQNLRHPRGIPQDYLLLLFSPGATMHVSFSGRSAVTLVCPTTPPTNPALRIVHNGFTTFHLFSAKEKTHSFVFSFLFCL